VTIPEVAAVEAAFGAAEPEIRDHDFPVSPRRHASLMAHNRALQKPLALCLSPVRITTAPLDSKLWIDNSILYERRKTMANPFVHVELHTQDPEKAKKFYKDLFDWKFEDVPDMEYTIIKVGEGTGGGMMKSPMPDALPQWVPYVLVDDIAASTEKAKSLGA
jgi:hypothetical protein